MMDWINKIHCGDALEVLRKMPDNFVDVTITSPPYNLGNDHHTGSRRHYCYNDNMHEGDYQNLQHLILDELYRITKNTGNLFYNHKNRIRNGLMISPYLWIFNTKWLIKQEIVWINGTQNFDKIRFYPYTERIYWLVKSSKTVIENKLQLKDYNNWYREGSQGEFTRAFPESMINDILHCLPDAKIVLDCYCGWGTVPIAAKIAGKKYIGIEINPEYVAMAEKRIHNEAGLL